MIILSRWIRNNPNRSWCHSILLCRLPNHSYYSQKLLQKQSSFGWRNLSHLVSTRVPKFIYGALIHIIYDSSNLYRFQNALTSASGARRLRGSFSIIRLKVCCLFPVFKNLSMLLLIRYQRLHLPLRSITTAAIRPKTSSQPWYPYLFSASSGLENRQAGSGGGGFYYQREPLQTFTFDGTQVGSTTSGNRFYLLIR